MITMNLRKKKYKTQDCFPFCTSRQNITIRSGIVRIKNVRTLKLNHFVYESNFHPNFGFAMLNDAIVCDSIARQQTHTFDRCASIFRGISRLRRMSCWQFSAASTPNYLIIFVIILYCVRLLFRQANNKKHKYLLRTKIWRKTK